MQTIQNYIHNIEEKTKENENQNLYKSLEQIDVLRRFWNSFMYCDYRKSESNRNDTVFTISKKYIFKHGLPLSAVYVVEHCGEATDGLCEECNTEEEAVSILHAFLKKIVRQAYRAPENYAMWKYNSSEVLKVMKQYNLYDTEHLKN